MTRLVLALTALCCCLSSGTAAFSPGKPAASPDAATPAGKGTADLPMQTQKGNPYAQLVITGQSEVLLDGRACGYEQVPEGAVITFAEVASDRRTVLKIHFQSPK